MTAKGIMRKKCVINKIGVFIFSIMCVATCVIVAQLFSSFLTVGSLPVSLNSNGTFSEFKIYAISLGSYATKTLAENSAVSYREKNAGGYVYKLNSLYHILASGYEKENDAKLVQDNLLKENINTTVVTITFDKVQLKNISSATQEKEFTGSLDIFKVIFVNLYDISVSLDTSIIDQTKAKIEIIAIKAKVEEELEGIKKGTTAIDGIYYQIIKNKLNSVIDILNELKNYEEKEGIILSAKIKYTYLQSLEIASDLIDSLNNQI